MLIILTILLFAFSCVIGCFTETFRKCALPIFIGFTVVMSILVGISICAYNSKVVLMAAGITFILVLALSAYACKFIFNPRDLEKWLHNVHALFGSYWLCIVHFWSGFYVLERSTGSTHLFMLVGLTILYIFSSRHTNDPRKRNIFLWTGWCIFSRNPNLHWHYPAFLASPEHNRPFW